MKRIAFGTTVTDSVTGFTGKVTARAEYITGCVQYGVTPPVDKDGNVRDTHWCDEGRLVVGPVAVADTGGPQDVPNASKHP